MGVEYAAFLCEIPAKLVRLSTEYATIDVTERPTKAQNCAFSIWTVADSKRVFVGPTVSFEAPKSRDPQIHDSFPTFYAADSPTLPTHAISVRITGTNLQNTVRVVSLSLGSPLECGYIYIHRTGLDCVLPSIPTYQLPKASDLPLVMMFFLQQSDHTALEPTFRIQAVRHDGSAVDDYKDDYRIHSGQRIALTMTQPLMSVMAIPWAPVLVDASSGVLQHSASFTDVVWHSGGKNLTATVRCNECISRRYYVHVGEASANSDVALTSSSAVVLFREDMHAPATDSGPFLGAAAAADGGESSTLVIFLSVVGVAVLALIGAAAVWRSRQTGTSQAPVVAPLPTSDIASDGAYTAL
jgi:hypothetical protein